jgi:hypothetical protein
VEAGIAPSVSGFVQHAVGVSLDDVARWGALLAEALQETGGALSGSERAWAARSICVSLSFARWAVAASADMAVELRNNLSALVSLDIGALEGGNR